MPYLTIPRQVWDERLPNGQSVDEAVRKPRVSFGPSGLSGITPPQPPVKFLNPDIAPEPTSGLPNYPAQPIAQQPPINVRIGANTQGLNPLEKSSAILDTERQAARDFPSSRVTSEGEILPPKMHHGFKDKLKSGLKGLVINMGEYARTHPGAELPELLGAGGAGAAVGGISPISIDRQIANAAVQRHEGELAHQLGIAKEQAQIDKLGNVLPQKPVYETRSDAEGNEIRQQWNPQTGKLEDVIGPDGNPVVVKKPRPVRPPAVREPIIKTVQNADGTTTTKKSTDNGATWVTIPELTSQPKPDAVDNRQSEERQRKFDAANRELGSLVEAEKNAATAKDKAFADYGNLQAQYSRQPDENTRAALRPQLQAAKDAADKAQAFYATFGAKKTAAQKAVDENASPKLSATEQKIYDAATKKGLDPDEALRRYRAGKY